MTDQREERKAARRRVSVFGHHPIGYFVAMVVLAPIDVPTRPDEPWFVLPMVGWGVLLALHSACTMNPFGGSSGGEKALIVL